jgi:hypothetical protein
MKRKLKLNLEIGWEVETFSLSQQFLNDFYGDFSFFVEIQNYTDN